MRLLLTRPREDSERSAAALRALGHEVLIVPLLRIEPVANADVGVGPWVATIMTSANAARAVAAHPRCPELAALPLFAVGRRTAEAARAVGFTDIRSADGDGHNLARFIAATLPDHAGRLLYLAGEDRATGLESGLTAAGFVVDSCVVYRAVIDPAFAGQLAAAMQDRAIDGVLHYSRRSASAFRAAAMAAGSSINSLNCRQYCLSDQVAEPLRDGVLGPVAVAARPDEAALFALLEPAR